MFLTEYNVRGSTVLPKQSITIAFSMDPRMAIEMGTSLVDLMGAPAPRSLGLNKSYQRIRASDRSIIPVQYESTEY